MLSTLLNHDPKSNTLTFPKPQVWLAWFDEGGAGKATHTYDDHQWGSCALNDCTGANATYLNTFRKDANISVSYTKPLFYWQNKAWADRWAANKTLVPMDEFYVGWMTVRFCDSAVGCECLLDVLYALHVNAVVWLIFKCESWH